MVKEGGCDAVKLEGGARVAEQIRAIRNAEIPVVGHLGLTPQSIKAFGGFKIQGKTEDAAKRLTYDALAIEEAGAGAVVVECVPAEVARTMTEKLTIPTIGIGAGPHCDGQVLVYQDLLGLYNGVTPKFVKRYADAGAIIKSAFEDYVRETKEGKFPDKERSFL
jgi:3-methyl-2-oxobutanoate hydroxymethyltransferase